MGTLKSAIERIEVAVENLRYYFDNEDEQLWAGIEILKGEVRKLPNDPSEVEDIEPGV